MNPSRRAFALRGFQDEPQTPSRRPSRGAASCWMVLLSAVVSAFAWIAVSAFMNPTAASHAAAAPSSHASHASTAGDGGCCCCCEGGGTEDFTSGEMQTLGSEYECCCCCCEGGGTEDFTSGGMQTLGSEYECCCCCEGGGEENFASGGAQTLGSEYECCCCCCCEGGGEENFASGGAQTLGSEYECCCCCEGGGTEDFNFASLDAIDEKSTQAEMLGEADRAELIAALKRQNEALREGGAWLYRVERSGGAALPEGFDAAAFAEDLAAIASRPFYASIPMRVRAAEPRLVPAERWPIFSADETSLVLLSPEHFYAIDAAGREYHEFTRVAASAKGRVVRVENVRRLASPASDGAEASALEIRIVETPGEKPRVVTSEGKVSFDLTAPEGAMTPWAFGLGGPFGARLDSDLVETILNGAAIRRIATAEATTTSTESHAGHDAQDDAASADEPATIWTLTIEPQASPLDTRRAGRPADLLLLRRDVTADGAVHFTLLGARWLPDVETVEAGPIDLVLSQDAKFGASAPLQVFPRIAAIRKSESTDAASPRNTAAVEAPLDSKLVFTATNFGDAHNLFNLLNGEANSLIESDGEPQIAYGTLEGDCCCAWCFGTTYYPHDPPELVGHGPPAYSFKVYPEEVVAFNTIAKDEDKWIKRFFCFETSSEVFEADGTNEFKNNWTISGKASFDPGNPDVKSITNDGINSGSVMVYIHESFGENDTITVTMTLDDIVDTNANDGTGLLPTTWTLTYKDTPCPEALDCQGVHFIGESWSTYDCDSEGELPAEYTYLLTPDLGDPGPRDYEGVSIQESFPAAYTNHTLVVETHITQAGQAAHPTWNAGKWADELWGGGSLNSSFTPNEDDKIVDTHGGFFGLDSEEYQGYVEPSPAQPLRYWRTQIYECNAATGDPLSQAVTIERTWYSSAEIKVKKTWQ